MLSRRAAQAVENNQKPDVYLSYHIGAQNRRDVEYIAGMEADITDWGRGKVGEPLQRERNRNRHGLHAYEPSPVRLQSGGLETAMNIDKMVVGAFKLFSPKQASWTCLRGVTIAVNGVVGGRVRKHRRGLRDPRRHRCGRHEKLWICPAGIHAAMDEPSPGRYPAPDRPALERQAVRRCLPNPSSLPHSPCGLSRVAGRSAR